MTFLFTWILLGILAITVLNFSGVGPIASIESTSLRRLVTVILVPVCYPTFVLLNVVIEFGMFLSKDKSLKEAVNGIIDECIFHLIADIKATWDGK